jgi:hypothetical protein
MKMQKDYIEEFVYKFPKVKVCQYMTTGETKRMGVIYTPSHLSLLNLFFVLPRVECE